MAWYWYLIIGVVLLVFIIFKASMANHKRFIADISTWIVGDKLILGSYYMDKAKENSQEYPLLVKWDEEEVLINLGDGSTHVVTHSYIRKNISDIWRNRYTRMDKFMDSVDKLVEFKPNKKTNDKGEVVETESKMDVTSKGGQVFIDDMPLLGMPQIYLTIYQGYALKEERFNLLAKINEELKKHR